MLPSSATSLLLAVASMLCFTCPFSTASAQPTVRKPTDWSYEGKSGASFRVKAAEDAKAETIEKMFADAGVTFPPRQLLLRAFKSEKELEVWAAGSADGALTHVATYEVCYMSGSLGPKRMQGDFQVPEGFYTLDLYNSSSRFYLSMRVSYPNESDKKLGRKGNLGSAIMIHGNCVSIGCLAMSDERIQELWLITRSVDKQGRRVQVHIFPSRDFPGLLKDTSYSSQHEFWKNLQQGYDLFEKDHKLFKVSVNRSGAYRFEAPQP